MNLAETVRRHAELRPAAAAIVDGSRTLSYRDFDRLVDRAAADLVAAGVGEGDRIGLCVKDHAEFLVLFFAIARSGAASLVIDWRTAAPLRVGLATGLGARLAVLDPGFPDIPGVPTLGLDWLWRGEAAEDLPRAPSAPGGGRPLTILCSSGTTGTPKGMVMSHDQWAARFRTTAGVAFPSPGAQHFSAGSLAFAGNLYWCLLCLWAGNTLVLYPPLFEPRELIAAVERYRPDTLALVPTIVRRLVELAPADRPLFPGLRCLITAGAALHPDEKRQIARRLTPNLYDCYGATAVGAISCLQPAEIKEHAESVGRALPELAVEIVDDDDRPLPADETGRLRCRGPSVFSGWAGEPAPGDPEMLRDGWYYSADLASIDAEGYLHLRGRAAEIINRGGLKIHAQEIERVLLAHPAVSEAAAIGYAAGDLGEEVAAFVVLRRPAEIPELIGHCRARLAAHEVPRRILVCESLPKTASGKIRKPDLEGLLQSR